jgi:hypothetical protein
MSYIKKMMFILSLIATAGVAYTLVTIKNIPDFNWDLRDEDEDEF